MLFYGSSSCAREQQGRSLRVLIDPVDQSVVESYSYSSMNHCHIRYRKHLIKKLERYATTSNRKTGLASSNRITPNAIAQLSLANPWATREMNRVEILNESNINIIKNLPKEILIDFQIVRTIDEGKEWIIKNRELLHRQGNPFKLVMI
ncbi:hypothetical protein I4U23_021852 [Adineta vaga]|nr:hypothetical protein I4U23_021852 [Adineta vaga]